LILTSICKDLLLPGSRPAGICSKDCAGITTAAVAVAGGVQG
jgi:hypothetical protein